MRNLSKHQAMLINGGSNWPIGQCYAPGHEPTTFADHMQDGHYVGRAVGNVLGYLAATLDEAFKRAKW